MITVIGLGVEKDHLTARGKEAVLSAERVFLRTDKPASAESVKNLGVKYEVLDEVFASTRSFAALHKKMAKVVLDAGKTQNVVYCVDGNACEDRCAQMIITRDKKAQIISGVSKAQYALEKTRTAATTCACVSAYDLQEVKNLTLPAAIYDLSDEFLAGDVKLILSDKIGEESQIFFLTGGKVKKIKVYELDRQKKYDYTTCVVVKDTPLLEKKRFDIADLKEILIRLRRPDGCPWDKVQTPESIRMNMVEEAYELVDAIDVGDMEKIREETGDVLLQAVFHAVMQEERGGFNLTDSLSELCEKLINRHTHIFGKDKANDEASALSVWEANKKKEKGQDTYAKAVNDVPSCFPACMRAQKVQKRAGKSGFDFKDAFQAAEKITEELKEWHHACVQGDKKQIHEELGDLLFAVVNAGRLSGVDCELALKESVQKFSRRFTRTEELILADGKDITSLSAEELDGYYIKAKTEEGKNAN